MKYVLDSSVALEWVLPEPFSAQANQLRADYGNALHELLSPDVFAVEIAHALAKAERQGRIAPPLGSVLWTDIMTTQPVFVPSVPLIPRAFSIASSARIGVYDCLYVALAEREKCDLVTADMRLINALQKQFPFIIHISSLP
jgi:predicted nucleic acid-binding protein